MLGTTINSKTSSVTFVDERHVRYTTRNRSMVVATKQLWDRASVVINARSILRWEAPNQDDSVDPPRIVADLRRLFSCDGLDVFIE